MIGQVMVRRGASVLVRGASLAVACSLLVSGQTIAAKPTPEVTGFCDPDTTRITWSGFRPVEIRGSWVLDINTSYFRYVAGSFVLANLKNHVVVLETPEVSGTAEINGVPIYLSSWTMRLYGTARDRAGNTVWFAGSPYSGTGVPTAPICATFPS